MIGAILGLATSVGSSIFGGIKAAKANREYKRTMRDLEKKQNDWYTQRYNEDYTQRADVQQLLSNARANAANLVRGAAGTRAVMGGTDEMMANAMQQAGSTIANSTSSIASQAAAYKNAVDNQNQQNLSNQAQQWMNYYAQSAANSQNAASEGMKAGMGLVGLDAMYRLDTSRYLHQNRDLFTDLFKRK